MVGGRVEPGGPALLGAAGSGGTVEAASAVEAPCADGPAQQAGEQRAEPTRAGPTPGPALPSPGPAALAKAGTTSESVCERGCPSEALALLAAGGWWI